MPSHAPGHLWRDKWTALSGPLSQGWTGRAQARGGRRRPRQTREARDFRGVGGPAPAEKGKPPRNPGEIGILLPNNQRQHRTLHIRKDVLPYAFC